MPKAIATRELLAGVVILVLAIAAGWALPRTFLTLKAGENWLRDFRLAALSAPEPQNPEVVVVAITEDTLATLPYRSPVGRAFLAGLVARLAAAKPKAIGLDVLFDQPTEAAKDQALRNALRSLSVPLVVGSATVEDGLTGPQHDYLLRFTDGLTTAPVNLVKDRTDGTVRWIYAGRRDGNAWTPGFAPALAKFAGGRQPRADLRLAYRPGPDRKTSAFRVFPAHVAKVLPDQWFAGKIVLVGADLPLIDRHRTPFAAALGSHAGSLPGILIMAHAVAQLIDGRQPPGIAPVGEVLLIALLAAAGLLAATLDLPLPIKGAAYVVSLAVIWLGGFALYRYGGLMAPLLGPTLGFAGGAGMGVAYLGRRDRQQKKFIREAFKHYVSPAIVERLVADPTALNVGGERRELTYVFTDLAGFTALTERTEPAVLVPLLNDYINGMCRIMFKHGATIDKIVGDAVVGFFNAPVDQADHAQRAVATALELDAFGQDFAKRQAANGVKFGVTRIGVHSGIAVIGNFGGDMFFDYTAHGDMVNTAARLESVNKHLGTRICVSGATAAACPAVAFRPVGSLVLKGKTAGIDVFEPLSDGAKDSPAVALYRRAFELLGREDPGARDAFGRVLDVDPDDALARFHLRRLERGQTGAVIVMEEK